MPHWKEEEQGREIRPREHVEENMPQIGVAEFATDPGDIVVWLTSI